MKDIFLSWIQWSGKGTQADLLMEKFQGQFKYFETWETLRTLSSTDNAIWNYLRDSLENGKLIKDEVVVELFKVFLQTIELEDHLLLDWVLRKIWQTKAICKEMENLGREFIVLHFDLPDEIVYQRLASRIMCSKCWTCMHIWSLWWKCEKCGWELVRRVDDSNIDAVKTRIDAFHRDTEPCIKWLEENGWLVHIDANRSVEEIFEDVLKNI